MYLQHSENCQTAAGEAYSHLQESNRSCNMYDGKGHPELKTGKSHTQHIDIFIIEFFSANKLLRLNLFYNGIFLGGGYEARLG
mmetsp:Transcript_17316/g.24227  ORF Transcript_17316/g.24227 Transcript_17316/m.24227 type:complete len:83 (-) Transcript_17316:1392-1640(-)